MGSLMVWHAIGQPRHLNQRPSVACPLCVEGQASEYRHPIQGKLCYNRCFYVSQQRTRMGYQSETQRPGSLLILLESEDITRRLSVHILAFCWVAMSEGSLQRKRQILVPHGAVRWGRTLISNRLLLYLIPIPSPSVALPGWTIIRVRSATILEDNVLGCEQRATS
jgi:hypothetical protein